MVFYKKEEEEGEKEEKKKKEEGEEYEEKKKEYLRSVCPALLHCLILICLGLLNPDEVISQDPAYSSYIEFLGYFPASGVAGPL